MLAEHYHEVSVSEMSVSEVSVSEVSVFSGEG